MTLIFAFALIGPLIDPLVAFAFGHMEAPECVYMLLQIVVTILALHITDLIGYEPGSNLKLILLMTLFG